MKASKQMVDAAIEDLGEQLEGGKSNQLQLYLKAMARFTKYSARNCILIAMQHPGATHVAGYGTWRKLGRQVMKGQKGIQIMSPVLRRTTLVLDNDEEITDEEPIMFRTAYVFDISQTEGRELPEPARVQGSPAEHLVRLKEFVAEQGIDLRHSALGKTEGVSSGGVITLNEKLEPANEFATLVHELAHEMLHQDDDSPADRTVRETEAEAVAYVVSEAIGLETSTASSDYLLTYKVDRKTLMQSLQRIRRTANVIIDGITKNTVEITGAFESARAA